MQPQVPRHSRARPRAPAPTRLRPEPPCPKAFGGPPLRPLSHATTRQRLETRGPTACAGPPAPPTATTAQRPETRGPTAFRGPPARPFCPQPVQPNLKESRLAEGLFTCDRLLRQVKALKALNTFIEAVGASLLVFVGTILLSTCAGRGANRLTETSYGHVEPCRGLYALLKCVCVCVCVTSSQDGSPAE